MDKDEDSRRYRVLDVVGSGGFGTVYRAEQTMPDGARREVALKVATADLDGRGDLLARLREEARLLRSFRHRAIVFVDALTRLGDRWAVVMEFVPGANVRELLDRERSIPLPAALWIAIEIAGGLRAAWEARVPAPPAVGGAVPPPGSPPTLTEPLRLLHRDVKPSNVQVTRQGDVKLLDFGIARSSGDVRRQEALRYGSVPYVAPERWSGADTHQSDVYSLALTLVEMVTGALPPESDAPTDRTARAGDLLRTAAAPTTLVAAVTAALHPDPAARPDAGRFAADLEAVAAALPPFDVRAWASERVGRLLDEHVSAAGELTGMSFAAGAVTTSELFSLGKATATFDDPSDPASGVPASGGPAGGAPTLHTFTGAAPPTLPFATQTPPDPAPQRAALPTFDVATPPDGGRTARPRWLPAAVTLGGLVAVGALALIGLGALLSFVAIGASVAYFLVGPG